MCSGAMVRGPGVEARGKGHVQADPHRGCGSGLNGNITKLV